MVARSGIKWNFYPFLFLELHGWRAGVQFKEEKEMKIHCGVQRSHNASRPEGPNV